jgi:hypothetical protein
VRLVSGCRDRQGNLEARVPSAAALPHPQATPTLEGGELYLLDSAGMLRCFEEKNGKVRWQKDLVTECGTVRPFYGFAGSPVLAGSLVILTANSGMALERTTGRSSGPPIRRRKISPATIGIRPWVRITRRRSFSRMQAPDMR